MEPQTHLPQAFIDKMASLLPQTLSLDDFIRYCRTPLRKSIRVNTLKISIDDFVSHIQIKGWRLTPIPWCKAGFWLERPSEEEDRLPLGNTAEHLAGLFYIQEASSMLPVSALLHGGDSPERALDMAAAPGSKTTQLAACMQGEGLVVANELSASRVKVLVANLQRCGVRNVLVSHYQGQVFGEWLPESFDAILLDAPCGGEGTVRKDPLAMKNWSPQAIENIASVQKELLHSAFLALKPGGTLIYSTCTLSPEENQQVVADLLGQYPTLAQVESLEDLFDGASKVVTPEGYLHVWPQVFDSEGFFVARLTKRQALSQLAKPKKVKVTSVPAPKKTEETLKHYLDSQFGLTLPSGELMQKDKDLWLFPSGTSELIPRFRFNRCGLKLATQHKNGFRLTHDAAIALAPHINKNRYELSEQQLVEFYKGRDLNVPELSQGGELVLCFNGHVVGLGKALNGRIKNGLPRELVRDDRVVKAS
ncbi:16S rRNA (cytosine(1407)-C(5))-methyltransferase [Saliniradius amylolyticus]|uniref:Ribosomal RNA small subunit methyltransferase F n=1 Tax=Saliniradius amylolyticus TaxID=2183582 RepID=A0A2S2E2L6_9ALTE|nr:16S rRNA (cytosine(1407)-C(5))-methyltransferase RsmF [Saliniradius amylolyticus]AWL11881.1 16S rRNA (cytosine(1407)-C(5))-methyltransferase [Saliniradius amylolyticus]